MLRIGPIDGKVKQLDDRWGNQSGYWEAPGWFWMCPCEWKHLDTFQQPPSPFVTSPRVDLVILSKLKLNPADSAVWEFNALASDQKGWIRHYVVLCTPKFRIWSWWEARVLYPLRKVQARVMRYLRENGP